MIKQKIVIAFSGIIFLLSSILLLFGLLKVQIVGDGAVTIQNDTSYLVISNEYGRYIESRTINKVNINYKSQKYSCKIYYQEEVDNNSVYEIRLPPIIYTQHTQLSTKIILDSVNIYYYLFLVK